MNNNMMLLDLHRNALAGQKGADNQNQSVSTALFCAFKNSTDHP